jgi:hypothetical protein
MVLVDEFWACNCCNTSNCQCSTSMEVIDQHKLASGTKVVPITFKQEEEESERDGKKSGNLIPFSCLCARLDECAHQRLHLSQYVNTEKGWKYSNSRKKQILRSLQFI